MEESEDENSKGIEIINATRCSKKPESQNIDQTRSSIDCPSCGHNIQFQDKAGIFHDLPGLPAGVKFDPSDHEILEHLEAKTWHDSRKLHPLIDEFIPTLEGENGICCTHPEKLPGVSKDGQIRHFFHKPSKAYTTGTRKRRKVHTDEDGSETRWHKTGKTRPVFVGGALKGFKKILVLYTNYGRQKKPEKTNWVMHQYHLGNNEDEKDGEIVVSKVFYQTQPRQCGKDSSAEQKLNNDRIENDSSNFLTKSMKSVEYYHPSFISYAHVISLSENASESLISNSISHGTNDSTNVLIVPHVNKFGEA